MRQRTSVRAGAGGAALVVPDPVVPYRAASFAQVTSIELASASTLVACDVLTAGRVAYGERWSATRLDSTLSIAIDERRVLHDRIVLAGDAAAHLGRFGALGTAVLLGPRVCDLAAAQLAALERVSRGAPVIVAGSPLADGAVLDPPRDVAARADPRGRDRRLSTRRDPRGHQPEPDGARRSDDGGAARAAAGRERGDNLAAQYSRELQRDAQAMRGTGPTVFAQVTCGVGVPEIARHIESARALALGG